MKDEIINFFSNKKNASSLLALTLMIIILPLAIVILKQQQIYFSKASGEMIKIGTGKCIQEKDGKKVLICNEIPLVMAAPFDPNAATSTAQPTSTATTSATPVPPPTTAPNGLVAHWKLDEASGTVIDDSAGNHDGVATGPTVIQGKFGNARQFAAGNMVDLGNATDLNPQTAITLSAWAKPDASALTGAKTIIERRTAANVGGWILGLNSGKPIIYVHTTAWQLCEATTAVTGANWDLVTGTYDGTNLKIYLNGALSKTCPVTGQIAVAAVTTLMGTTSISDANQKWTGGIDEVMVYNKALTDAQVQGLVTNTIPTAFAPLPNTIASIVTKLADAVVPSAVAYDKHFCDGDTTAGVGGLIDVITNGCGEVLNYSEIYRSCVSSSRIQYKPPVWNATKREWETIKQDGSIISQAEMVQKAQRDGRFPIALSSTANPPWINCEVYFEYSGRNDCDVTPQKNAANQPMGREGTELNSGQQFYMDVAKTATPATGDPDCKQQVQVELASATTPTPTPTTATPTPTSQCTLTTGGNSRLTIPPNCGTITNSTVGSFTYTAPNVTSDTVCDLKVTTDGNDCKLDGAGKGTAANPIKPNESMNISLTNACIDNVPGCNLPVIISQNVPIPTDKVAYKLAESESGLTSASELGYTTPNFTTTYTLTDTKPGPKTIFVQFIDKRTGEKKTDFTTIELIEQNPLIKQVGCQLDIEKNSVNFDLSGLRFGTEGAKATANGSELDVVQHTDTTMKAILKNVTATGDQVYKVKVTRKDNLTSEEVQCRLGISQISLGAKVFCRGQGKFNVSNVKLVIIDQNNKKTEETTTITNDGVITGLKTKFETGKNYTISIDAPILLRRNISFTAKDGTTVITKDDGTTLILPVGDIFPITGDGDGTINTLDQAELKRQWRNVESTNTATLTADFNQDKRVNAFDWSCMRKDFGSSDDPLAAPPATGSAGVNFNNQGGANSGTISVQFGAPSPNPDVVPVPGSTPDDTTGISNEEPRRFIQAP